MLWTRSITLLRTASVAIKQIDSKVRIQKHQCKQYWFKHIIIMIFFSDCDSWRNASWWRNNINFDKLHSSSGRSIPWLIPTYWSDSAQEQDQISLWGKYIFKISASPLYEDSTPSDFCSLKNELELTQLYSNTRIHTMMTELKDKQKERRISHIWLIKLLLQCSSRTCLSWWLALQSNLQISI